MSKLTDSLKTAYKTAYKLEKTKDWSDIRIYHGGDNFDLKKRWYAYYEYRNPLTGEMERQTPITLGVNRSYKTKRERLQYLQWIKEETEHLFESGYSPYTDGCINEFYTTESSLKFALSLKKATLKKRSYQDYENRLSHFILFLKRKKLHNAPIGSVTKKVVNDFLNKVLLDSGPRNRNNTRIVLSSLFTLLESNEVIDRNFIKNIDKLKAPPKRNKTYSKELSDNILAYIEKNDPLLSFFIKVISYNILRPIEGCRLKIKHINLKEKIIEIAAKNKPTKYKRIPDILIPEYKKLNFEKPEFSVFSIYGIEDWTASESAKRDYMTGRFLKVKKIFNLDKDYTMYSLCRHTFITQLFRSIRKKHSKSETIDILMSITGHETREALLSYLRDIDAELADDYTPYLNKKSQP